MYIKVWNNRDRKTYRISPALKKFYEKEICPNLKPKQKREIKKLADIIAETIAITFVHNLQEGWEEKLLKLGHVLNRRNVLLTKTQ